MTKSRKRGRGRRGKLSISVLPLIPVAAVTWNAYKAGGGLNSNMLNQMSNDTLGYNFKTGAFAFGQCLPFIGGEVLAVLLHKAANRFGVNAVIRRATMGIIGL